MFPRWLSWLLLAVMGYLLFVGGVGRPPQHAPQPVAENSVPVATEALTGPEASQYPNLAAATDVERWKRAVNPDYAAKAQCSYTKPEGNALALKVMDETDGSGEGAKCTDMIRVKITVWNPKGTPLYTGENVLTLGSRDIAAGLDAALIGLRSGGSRFVILPPASLVHDKKTGAPKALLAALSASGTALVTVTRLTSETEPTP